MIATRMISHAGLILSGLVLAACFLPIPYTETGSPPLVGLYAGVDSQPIAGRRLAIATSDDGPGCPTIRAETRTDSLGRFAFERTTIRHRGAWVMPPIEKSSNIYWLCVDVGDSTFRRVFARQAFLGLKSPPDTLICKESLAFQVPTSCRAVSDHP
jgi:hypothetical protein